MTVFFEKRILTSWRHNLGKLKTMEKEAREKGEGAYFMDTTGLFYAIGNYAINDIEAIT